NGEYLFTINFLQDIPEPNFDSAPIAMFFPKRLKNIKIISGQNLKPIIADNFIMLTPSSPMQAGAKSIVTFTAEEF
ncbi:MAG: hypothetical protein ACRC37_02595, partial [Lentisphaeria bacterium]